MAQSKVELANIALQMIGSKRIASFAEDSREARAVATVYDDIRDEVLAEHPWSFAQKRAVLATLADAPVFTEDRMRVVYAKPNDLVRLNFMSDPSAVVKVEQNGILSDTLNLKILYTYRNDDPTTYFAKFTMAMATRLAAELCFHLSESAAKSEKVLEAYETIRLPRAVAEDSQQSTPVQPMQDEWTWYRIYGSAGFPSQQPGAQTWHPSW